MPQTRVSSLLTVFTCELCLVALMSASYTCSFCSCIAVNHEVLEGVYIYIVSHCIRSYMPESKKKIEYSSCGCSSDLSLIKSNIKIKNWCQMAFLQVLFSYSLLSFCYKVIIMHHRHHHHSHHGMLMIADHPGIGSLFVNSQIQTCSYV